MSYWATKRKLGYSLLTIFALVIFIAVPLFLILYQTPTCFDNEHNQDELGVDCGGSCVLVCRNTHLEPIVHWQRSFRVTDSVYNAVAYVENPNIEEGVNNISYLFKVYDKDGSLLAKREGVTFIPKQKAFAVFEGGIAVGERAPVRTTFEFTGDAQWTKNTSRDPEIFVTNKALTNEEFAPRIDAVLDNRSLETIENVEIVALVYDDDRNAIGASRTLIEDVEKAEKKSLVFTWPEPFQTSSEVCQVPNDVLLVLDRSGSMSFDGDTPPQPLTDVKRAAESFLKELQDEDRVGLASFATEVFETIDQTLTSNITEVISKVSEVSIQENGLQHTNIGDGLKLALGDLEAHVRDGANRIIILLTDGVATRPLGSTSSFAEDYALSAALDVARAGIELYTIGLGDQVDPEFLSLLATSNAHYFNAENVDLLPAIYEDIAEAICEKQPTIIEIIPRIIPN